MLLAGKRVAGAARATLGLENEASYPCGGMQGVDAMLRIGRFHIVAIGSLGALTFSWVFFGRWDVWAAGFAAIDWYIVNLLNRVVDLPEDRANKIVGTDFVARHRSALLVFGVALLGLSLAASAWLAPALVLFRLGFHALGFAYNWSLLGVRRIKERYFWKNTASAVGFVLTVFAYPLALGRAHGLTLVVPVAGLVVIICFFLLFELSYEVLYDLRDVEGDRREGIRTYPVVHGERAAVRIANALMASSVMIAVAGYAVGVIPWRAVVMVAAPLFQLVYFSLRRRSRREGAPSVEAADCIRLTWVGAGMLATFNVWAALGGPGV